MEEAQVTRGIVQVVIAALGRGGEDELAVVPGLAELMDQELAGDPQETVAEAGSLAVQQVRILPLPRCRVPSPDREVLVVGPGVQVAVHVLDRLVDDGTGAREQLLPGRYPGTRADIELQSIAVQAGAGVVDAREAGAGDDAATGVAYLKEGAEVLTQVGAEVQGRRHRQ